MGGGGGLIFGANISARLYWRRQNINTEEMNMKRPLAYITAAWGDCEFETTENAAKYCRAVYEAGFNPICPILFMPLFLNNAIPAEHKNNIDMSRDLLKRARVVVVCGRAIDEAVKNDIATAQRLGIMATTLDGIMTIRGQGHSSRL